MNRFELDPRARQDIKDIFAYIARDSVTAAERVVGRLFERFELLAANPQMGELRSELQENMRSVSVGNYVIYFRLEEPSLQIMRVLHGAREVNAIFRKSDE